VKRDKESPRQQPTAPVDWNQVRKGLELVATGTHLESACTAAEKRRILRARARELAFGAREKPATKEFIEVVAFLLAHEKYGIETCYVREVYPLKELTPLPCTPPFVLGIISVRGKVLSVIDLKKFFDLPEKGLTDLNKVIVVRTEEMELGILADEILGVQQIALEEDQPPPPTLTGIRAEYLRGVTQDRLVVLEAAKILSDQNIVVQEEVGTQSRQIVRRDKR
jgi:purine-binding chemotaxis protein CheW